jgi:hypothetical protein
MILPDLRGGGLRGFTDAIVFETGSGRWATICIDSVAGRDTAAATKHPTFHHHFAPVTGYTHPFPPHSTGTRHTDLVHDGSRARPWPPRPMPKAGKASRWVARERVQEYRVAIVSHWSADLLLTHHSRHGYQLAPSPAHLLTLPAIHQRPQPTYRRCPARFRRADRSCNRPVHRVAAEYR